MNITRIQARLEKLPLKVPYTIAYKTITDTEIVFLEITLSNGITGIGAANPFEEVVGETPAQTLHNLQQDYLQQFLGRDIRRFRSMIAEASIQYAHQPGTIAAIDLALHDAFGKYLGIPIVDFYGRKHRQLPTSVTIGIQSVADTLHMAKDLTQQGFTVLKVKTGLSVAEDAERIIKLREQCGTDMTIRVDANQGYTLDDLSTFLAQTKTANVELIDQPLPVGRDAQLNALPIVQRSQLCADESLTDVHAAWRLSHPPAPYGIYNIKLMKCGGILPALDIANIAATAGIRLFWGCNDESLASIAGALHVAYSCPHTRYLDLDGSFDLSRDFVHGGFKLFNGQMLLSDQPGLGIEWA